MKMKGIVVHLLMLFVLLILIGTIIQLLPIIIDLVNRATDESSVVEQIHSIGWRGVPAVLSLAVLEVIIPFIPGPAVGVIVGLSYGVYWGMLIFLAGMAIGNLIVMVYVRQIKEFVAKIRKKSHAQKDSHLKERIMTLKNPEYLAFFLTLIPFVSSFGSYLFAETRVRLPRYIIAVVLGNIPSAILYMYVGDHISRGNYETTIIIAAIAVVIIIFGIIFRKRLIEIAFESSK